ncbi:hypothetical protein EDB84DRAFT_1561796 [Lactarius hengduanensis]|nr:hypothetical protein EDB84DRAFT_1561796 [Lactarius hengduanensis]
MSHFHTQGPCTNFVDAAPSQPRTLILCFDGTSDKYDKDCTNIVKLYSLFNKDHVDQQLCYYQAGIGTYTAPGFISSIGKLVAKTLDMAVAWYLYQHILDGYQFLMRNYKVGDQICLFGFSRGAYTARALAGMLHKVGLLSKDNTEQIAFAYEHYASDPENDYLAKGFKEMFCRDVPIDFVGVWDTVASTGINGSLPFAGANTTIRVFRHALALDEHRVNFIPEYYRGDSEESSLGPLNEEEQVSNVPGNASKITPHEMGEVTDVKEVWFAGCHADVGGGVHDNKIQALSDISLRWMVRELVKAGVKVIFDEQALSDRGIPLPMITSQPITNGPQPQYPVTNSVLINPKKENGNQSSPNRDWPDRDADDVKDVKRKINDQLGKFSWKLLECIPTWYSALDKKGQPITTFNFHFGQGRHVPPYPYFHESVGECMKHGYKPKAIYTPDEETYVY